MKRWAVILLMLTMSAGSLAYAENVDPYITLNAKRAKVQKTEQDQTINGRWQNFAGIKPFNLGGERAMFFAQLHLYCTQKPRWVKIRLARLTDHGLDTTGTNTWVMGADSPESWQGSLYWESLTKYPIIPQFKVGGGKCYSPQRQFKYWMP